VGTAADGEEQSVTQRQELLLCEEPERSRAFPVLLDSDDGSTLDVELAADQVVRQAVVPVEVLCLELEPPLGRGRRAALRGVGVHDVSVHVEVQALPEAGRRCAWNAAGLLELHVGWRIDLVLLRENVAAAIRRKAE